MAGRRWRVVWAAAAPAAARRRADGAAADGAVGMRRHRLWRLRRGQAVGAVAATVGGHERPVPRWVRWSEAGGLAAVRTQRQRQGGAGPHPRLTAAHHAPVAAAVATGRFRAAAASGAGRPTAVGVRSRPGGRAPLLARLQGAPKVPRPRPATADLAAQARFTTGGVAPPVRPPAQRGAGAWASVLTGGWAARGRGAASGAGGG